MNERIISGIGLLYTFLYAGAGAALIALDLTDLAFWWFLTHALVALIGFGVILRADRRADRDRTR